MRHLQTCPSHEQPGIDPTAREVRLQPSVTAPTLYLLVAAWIASIPNAVTVASFAKSRSSGSGAEFLAFVFGGWLVVFTLTFGALVLTGLFARGRVAKVVAIIALFASAAASYFTTFLGTQFDRGMAASIVQTNLVEAAELLNLRLAVWVGLVALLPSIVVWRLHLHAARRWRQAAFSLATVALLLVIAGATVYAQYSRYASSARNRDISFGTVAPLNVVAGLVHHAATEFAARTVRVPRGLDARTAYAIPKSRLLVLVIGETARAANHGMNGYARDTTPRMSAAKGYYFADTESCGTVTTISVPCIFSGLSREDFSLLKGRQNETLIDVVKRSGARVLWLDNDSGCKDVCSAAEYVDLTGSSDSRFCQAAGDCHDEILLDGIEQRIGASTGDTLVVLHLKGSHGPSYYRRYPQKFEKYTPVCKTSDLSACDAASIVNAYDNTIVYTDHVVGEVIEILRRQSDRFATAMLYVSDHGESLGEAGLYLHGMPWSVAPREQKTVPMYAWVSPEFLKLERWDADCMTRQTQVRRSHDNVYATVLGFMEVESVEYKPARDFFEPCDPPAAR